MKINGQNVLESGCCHCTDLIYPRRQRNNQHLGLFHIKCGFTLQRSKQNRVLPAGFQWCTCEYFLQEWGAEECDSNVIFLARSSPPAVIWWKRSVWAVWAMTERCLKEKVRHRPSQMRSNLITAVLVSQLTCIDLCESCLWAAGDESQQTDRCQSLGDGFRTNLSESLHKAKCQAGFM